VIFNAVEHRAALRQTANRATPRGVHQKIFMVAADADSLGRDKRKRRFPSVRWVVCQSGAWHAQREATATDPNQWKIRVIRSPPPT
jgi:hypothetical protein